jgi:hypothetical protein
MKSVKFIISKKIKINCANTNLPRPSPLRKICLLRGVWTLNGWPRQWTDVAYIQIWVLHVRISINSILWWVKEIIFKKWLFIWKSGEFSIGSCYICPVTETFTSNKLSGYIYLIENIGSFTYGWVVHGARNFLTEGVNVPQWGGGGLCKFFHG